MRGLCAWTLAAVLSSGCIQFAPDERPSLLPVILLDGVAEDFLGCQEPRLYWDGTPVPESCHVVRLILAVPEGSRDVRTKDGWTAVTDRGGVYEGRLLSGPVAVVAGGGSALRLGFEVDDGGSLTQVRWTGPGNVTVAAPLGGYRSLTDLMPRVALRSAELSQFECEGARSLPCVLVTLAVDNTAGSRPFPDETLEWVARGEQAIGPLDVAAASHVLPGEAGSVQLVLDAYFPALLVGVRAGAWNVPLFHLPDAQDLRLADRGALMVGLDVAPLADPYYDEDGLLYLRAAARPYDADGGCTPFNGIVASQLHWQPGTLGLEELWSLRSTSEGPVTPESFGPWEPVCAVDVWMGMQEEDMRGTYRLRVTAFVEATGEKFTSETYFST